MKNKMDLKRIILDENWYFHLWCKFIKFILRAIPLICLIDHSLNKDFYNDYNKLILQGQVYYCIIHRKILHVHAFSTVLNFQKM